VILVRLLLFLALAAIAVSALMYLYSKDRRYLRFIWQVLKFTLVMLAFVDVIAGYTVGIRSAQRDITVEREGAIT